MVIEPKAETNFYLTAKQEVLSAGFAAELNWQSHRMFSAFTEVDLLREAAWVILCSGFRESVVRRCFDLFSLCFCDWESAAEICNSAAQCRATALTVFGNRKKVEAILRTATFINQFGFANLKEKILLDPINTLRALPFIGPVTSYHLAKNLGFATAKPDRHLVRLAGELGYSDVQKLCNSLSIATGDPIQVVDVVLWRYSERFGTDDMLHTSFPKLQPNNS